MVIDCLLLHTGLNFATQEARVIVVPEFRFDPTPLQSNGTLYNGAVDYLLTYAPTSLASE